MKLATFYFAPSALPELMDPHPGAMPQAVTFRALGAQTRSLTFHTVSYRVVVLTSCPTLSHIDS